MDKINELCSKYDIAVFKVADSCFAHTSSPEEQDKWFISTLAGETRFYSSETIPLADSEDEAKALAVRMYKLDSITEA